MLSGFCPFFSPRLVQSQTKWAPCPWLLSTVVIVACKNRNLISTHEISYLRPYGRKPCFSTEFVRHTLCSVWCNSVPLTSNKENVYLFLSVWLSIWLIQAVKQAVILAWSATLSLRWQIRLPHCHPCSLSCMQTLHRECHGHSGN